MKPGSTIRTYAVTAIVAAFFYSVPLGVMAAAVHLGWHADPPTRSQTESRNRSTHVLHTSAVPILLLVGDDNGDGVIDEDESGWDCRTMGNLICGPVIA